MATSTPFPDTSVVMESPTEIESLHPCAGSSWSTRSEERELSRMMNDLSISPYVPKPFQLKPRGRQSYRHGAFQWKLRPGKFAVVAIDNEQVAGVLDTVWFRHELKEGWHLDVLDGLERADVSEVFCCGNYLKLKRAAGDSTNVYLDSPENHQLRYPCNLCNGKGCAIQRAYLYWKRLNQRRKCNLEH